MVPVPGARGIAGVRLTAVKGLSPWPASRRELPIWITETTLGKITPIELFGRTRRTEYVVRKQGYLEASTDINWIAGSR